MKRPSSTALALIALLFLLALLLAAYIGGYFWLGEARAGGDPFAEPPTITLERTYRREWLADAFKPLALIESFITGRQVVIQCEESPEDAWSAG